VNQALENYRFDDAANVIYQFFWGSFCDWYLEIVKLSLDFSENADKTRVKAALTTLVSVFEASLRLLSPFMPFLTEEIWHAIYDGNPPAKSIALTRYPTASQSSIEATALAGMHRIQDLIVAIRARRKDINVPEKERTSIWAFWDAGSSVGSLRNEVGNVYRENEKIIQKLANVSSIEDKDYAFLEKTPEAGWRQAGGPFISVVYERKIDKAAECEKLSKEIAKQEKIVGNSERQLNNPGFTSKAPAHIVDGLKKQLNDARLLLEKLRHDRDSLGC
jgi:valyl-tRNA synthetase